MRLCFSLYPRGDNECRKSQVIIQPCVIKIHYETIDLLTSSDQ